jgi:hypothetical protein
MDMPLQLFKCHVENLRSVKRAVASLEHPLKNAVSRQHQNEEDALTKLYALLVAAKLECRLQKLLYQPDGFDESLRAQVLAEDTQLDRWLRAIAVAFQFQYNVRALSEETLKFTAWSQYRELTKLVQEDLRPIIELRNKLAHGQWEYSLNSTGTGVAQDQMRDLKTLNFTRIRLQSALADYICDDIHELVVARDARARNFDQHYNRILETRRNLEVQSHERWSEMMRRKYRRVKRG